MLAATIIGSGPNGLSAAIVLAAAGFSTTVFERNVQIGAACSTAEITLPDFRQDLGSSVYPMGVASPFLRSLSIDIPRIEPTAPCAHPLDDGTAVMLEHSIDATIANLDACDRARYRSLIESLALTLPSYLKTFSRPFSTSLATHFCSRVLVRQHSYLQHLWPVLISRGNALRLYLPVWRLIRW
jgi:phytoene dehydrogenase-like protein